MFTSKDIKRRNSAGAVTGKPDDDDLLPPIQLNFAKTEAPGLRTLQLAKADEKPEFSVNVNENLDS